jgi:hypothetical protein
LVRVPKASKLNNNLPPKGKRRRVNQTLKKQKYKRSQKEKVNSNKNKSSKRQHQLKILKNQNLKRKGKLTSMLDLQTMVEMKRRKEL